MKNINNSIKAAFLILIIGFWACEDKYVSSFNPDSDVEIKAFSINGLDGAIDHQTRSITLTMPTGTDLSSLIPSIHIPEGAHIIPASGESVNFAFSERTPVQYSIYNGDLYNTYSVIIKELKAEITSFTVNGQKGTIDQKEKTILVYVSEGTDITKLNPVIEYTQGAKITPESGMPVDFTEPVEYKLDYMNQVFIYTVTVKTGTNVAEKLIIYNGEDIVPQWWTVGSAGDIGSTFENPKSNALNATSYCASIWRNPGDDPWTGGGLGGLDINPNTYTTFTLMVWKETAGDVQMEIQGEGPNAYLKAHYSSEALGEWQKLTFSLPEGHGLKKITTILVAPQIDDTKEDPSFFGHRMYWDELIALL